MGDVVVFANARRVTEGSKLAVARALRRRETSEPLLAFELDTGAAFDFDLRGSDADVVARYGEPAPGPGRPKLGVVAREVTLLPRHWEWLSGQRGGASAALRRLIDAARAADQGQTEAAAAKSAAYRLLAALAGDWPNFEDAARALFADDLASFRALVADWPGDVAAVALARLQRNNAALSASFSLW